MLRDYFTRELRGEKRKLEDRLKRVQKLAQTLDDHMTAVPPAPDSVKLAAYEDLMRVLEVK